MNINNWECLFNLEKIYNKVKLSSAFFLKNNNDNYIITCNDSLNEPIKIFDFKGNIIKIINDSNDISFFIDVYYDKKNLKNYIITGNKGYIKSYDYNNNIIYHKYFDKDKDLGICYSISIKIDINIIKLISSFESGYIIIWNFHNGDFMNKIKIGGLLYGICLWNDEYLFVGNGEHKIKLIDLKEGKIIKELNGHNNEVVAIKKIFHPKYGECLISSEGYSIILWKNKN